MDLKIMFFHVVFSGIFSTITSQDTIALPSTVQDTLTEMTDFEDYIHGLDRVNITNSNTTKAIYRKDLDPSYIAYYEIEAEEKYVLLSAGPGTGDYRQAQSGPSPRPTGTLIKQAREHGHTCVKFFRLTPLGLFMCENAIGRAVAATFNWTAESPVENWMSLQTMVQESEKVFAQIWRDWSEQISSELEWRTTGKRSNLDSSRQIEEVVFSGSVVRFAVKENTTELQMYIKGLGSRHVAFHDGWQKKLCQVLLNLCQGNSSQINSAFINRTMNGLLYLQFEVHKDNGLISRLFHNQDVGFAIVQSQTVLRHYVIKLAKRHRERRSYPVYTSRWQYYIIPEERLMPDYDQHQCCGRTKQCFSGCTAVAWAMIFAYYDRVAHSKRSRGYSKNIFRCKDGITGSPACVAPGTLTRPKLTHNVKKFVESIRGEMLTYCQGLMGTTRYENIELVEKWFKSRQGSGARVSSYVLAPGWKWGTSNSTLPYEHSTLYGGEDWIRDKAISAVRKGYPVNVGVKFSWDHRRYSPSIHSAVVTQYRYRYKDYRVCWPRMRSRYDLEKHIRRRHCQWKRVHDHQFYYHQGFGGGANGWYKALAQTAHVATIQ